MRAVVLALFTAIALTCTTSAHERGLPAREGIPNFGQVNEGLYRGAQPDADVLINLRRLGIKAIIDLRTPREVWKAENPQARAHGITYTNVPLSGLGRPTDKQIQTVLSLIDTLPKPVYIHCKYGCDRTGTVVACYRISREGWTSRIALSEAKLHGMSKWLRGMRHYVEDFGKAHEKRGGAGPTRSEH